MAEAAIQKLNLPPRLVTFFARYPPQVYSAKFTGTRLPLTRKEAKEAAIAKAATLKAQKSSVPQPTAEADAVTRTEAPATPSSNETNIPTPTPAPSATETKIPPNPFLPRKNPITGRWAGAKIGLRRQAELVKLAKKYGIEELLPPSRKSTAFKEARLLERGLRVRGTGEGQKVKGHKWERHVGANLEKRRTAMEQMPALVREWKQVRFPMGLPQSSLRLRANPRYREAMAEAGRNIPNKGARLLDFMFNGVSKFKRSSLNPFGLSPGASYGVAALIFTPTAFDGMQIELANLLGPTNYPDAARRWLSSLPVLGPLMYIQFLQQPVAASCLHDTAHLKQYLYNNGKPKNIDWMQSKDLCLRLNSASKVVSPNMKSLWGRWCVHERAVGEIAKLLLKHTSIGRHQAWSSVEANFL